MKNQTATPELQERPRPMLSAGRRARAQEPDRERQLILVAEDSPQDWEIYGKVLWYNGFDVIHAVDGEEALELVREHLPDLVILDLMLPKLDGIEVCRRLKMDEATRHIPVIALSARARWEMAPEARDVGCTGYLEKPIGPLAVLHAVEALVGKPPPAGLEGDGPQRDDPGGTHHARH